ncbi:hypothetical protein C8K15_10453 [Paenisporosarcina sp. OV554]|nr:hypothetical protein C8K15_10453 [Paenisporosarcina sp. OV554]
MRAKDMAMRGSLPAMSGLTTQGHPTTVDVLNKLAFLVFDIYVMNFSMSGFVSTMRAKDIATRESLSTMSGSLSTISGLTTQGHPTTVDVLNKLAFLVFDIYAWFSQFNTRIEKSLAHQRNWTFLNPLHVKTPGIHIITYLLIRVLPKSITQHVRWLIR